MKKFHVETIDRLASETRLMNVIRRLVLLTMDMRPEDINKITDCIDSQLHEIMDKINSRSLIQSYRLSNSTRKEDGRHVDRLG